MSVKIRLARRGRKKLALFDIIVADARAARDGKFIEKIGVYNPNTNPATIELNEFKAFDWLMKGAQPTETVKAMLSYKGILFKKHLQVGVLKGALSQEDADKKLAAWLESKSGKIENKISKLSNAKATAAKEKLEAEAKVNAAREEAIKKKNTVEEPVAEAPAEQPVAEVAAEPVVEAVETPATEAPAEQPTVEAATPEPAVETVAEPVAEIAAEEPKAE